MLPAFAIYFYVAPVTRDNYFDHYTNWFWNIIKSWADLNTMPVRVITKFVFNSSLFDDYNFGNLLMLYWVMIIPNNFLYGVHTLQIWPVLVVYWIVQVTYNIVYALVTDNSNTVFWELLYQQFVHEYMFVNAYNNY